MKRRGFTLIELMIVMTIILVLSAVTIAAVNFSINADRVRSGARQIQSLLAGARDKAIYAKENRGVRLLLDPNDNHAVGAVQYIGSPQQENSQTTGNLIPFVTTGPTVGFSVMLPPTAFANRWKLLMNRGFLKAGCRIRIPLSSGSRIWYTISSIAFDTSVIAPATASALNPILTLGSEITLPYTPGATFDYTMQLAPGPLGDAQPVLLPRGVVIDLDGSAVPSTWKPSTFAGSYSQQMDILFTPQGTIVGDVLTAGMLHLHFADAFDVASWRANALLTGRIASSYAPPIVPADASDATPPLIVTRDRILTTVSARTGNVSVHHVNAAGATAAVPLASDPFLFAETGQIANK